MEKMATAPVESACPEVSAMVSSLIARGRDELAKGNQTAASKLFAEAVEAADKVDERVAMKRSCSQSAGVYLLKMGRARDSMEHLQQVCMVFRSFS